MKHCYCSRTVGILAYAALVYLGASLVYLVLSKCLQYNTPFKDTLSDDQRRVLDAGKRKHGLTFAAGVVLAALVLVATRPLRSLERNTR